ncbi:non-specific lipid transfer protein GPI-anchored 2-like [Triticum dicoccoides]|uniref:non-specific lipid transfer protein GPI-anchored 2-like n=1 Tax=Triticum dicoccoides TaxID=85692 RepID=UPI00188DEEDB|nr:non-specific lipid transfer protein GPI-anchored 2-like [Triticum dicoccoides]
MGATYANVALLGLVLAVAAALLACQCAAQAPAPAPSGGGGGSGCMPELVSLSPCMGYMSGNATAPGEPCCAAVSGVLRSSPRCLCAVLGGTAATLGVAVDGARALQMPAACKVQAPPASQCDAMGAPMSSPATPYDPDVTPAGSGSKATPTPQYSHGNVNGAGRRTLAFAVAVVAIALTLVPEIF